MRPISTLNYNNVSVHEVDSKNNTYYKIGNK